MSGTVIIERVGSTMVITINRPGSANAIDVATALALDAALGSAEEDADVAVIVITGAGERAFCAGLDLKQAATEGAGDVLIAGRGIGGISQRRFVKPVIAAVNGAAIGGGFEIVLACDIAITHEGAVFGLPEVKRGLFAFAGGIQRLAKQLPRSSALQLILVGEPVPARRLYDLGVISHLVPADEVLATALRIADAIAANSADALGLARQLFDFAADASLDASFDHGLRVGFENLGIAQAAEGIRAFAEKRPAHFASASSGAVNAE